MEAIILHPQNKEQLSVFKKLFKTMDVPFETKEEKEDLYSSEFVASILQGDEDYKNGKSVKNSFGGFMEIAYTPLAQEHLAYWRKSGNKAVQKKITALIEDIFKHPYEGIGKPEGLKYDLTGKWARRITEEHRLVYEIKGDNVLLISRLKGHYSDK